ncbi:MAG TPA: sulfatase [Phycisphaerales bacterium]|nr:sulfatase [Phycisphaerales bacterium]HCD32279.1 sulfatase [Phycisphaerales bacterium]|tara:strand:- start:63739 stop:65277 length:1539 start_codon:yes stop_codon:yes gene_type:complete
MKAIMVMFDTLNRHFLPNYGCDWTHAPNFSRLGEKTVTFDNSYVCSMPCMPARRELHTGRPNFLHRSWGPIEPFDDSVPQMLKQAGVHTHLSTDHQHYFEDGGCTYHTRYSSWDFHRGQEGDPWIGQVGGSPFSPTHLKTDPDPNKPKGMRAQDMINRQYIGNDSEKMPQHGTFTAGLDFIDRNHDADNWFLQIETFDPHEPFYTQPEFKKFFEKHYAEYTGPDFDWPGYGKVTEAREVVEHCRYEYAALLAMCDCYLGKVLDAMDKHNLWDDTMLIVNTDHGFMLGEHDSWAKCWLPFYQEIAHTPFFVWDPRPRKFDSNIDIQGQRRKALVQPSIDIPLTLLDYFGVQPTKDMIGKSLTQTIVDDTPIRDAAIFGIHGGQVNVTDGEYVYMRGYAGDENVPLNNYTLMPTHMRNRFHPDELKEMTLSEPLSFTKGVPVLKTPCNTANGGRNETFSKTMLFDLKSDYAQQNSLKDEAVEKKMIDHLVTLLKENDAPAEQYQRLGLHTETDK